MEEVEGPGRLMAGGDVYGHCSSFPPEEGLAGARRGLRITLRTPEERRQRPVGSLESESKPRALITLETELSLALH